MARQSKKICLREACRVIESHLIEDRKLLNDHDESLPSLTPQGISSAKLPLSYVDHILRGVGSTHQQLNEYSPTLFDTPLDYNHLPDSTTTNNTTNGSTNTDILLPVNNACKTTTQYRCPPNMCTLNECSVGGVVSVMALIVEVSPVSKVTIKNGPIKYGESVSMSSIMVADPSLSQFTITLWRECALWVERLSVGDIVILTGIKVKLTRAKIATGHSMMNSGVLNLHQPNKLPGKLCGRVPEESFMSFLRWSKREYYYLFNQERIPKSQRLVQYIPSVNIKPTDALVHFRGKVTSFINDNVITVSDDPSTELLVLLVGGDSKKWSKLLQKGVGLVWEMTYLQVLPEGSQSGFVSLQTTSCSSFCCIVQDCCLATDILQRWCASGVVEYTSINSIISEPRSGRYQLKATQVSMRIISNTIDINIDPMQLSSVLPNMVYSGCGQCTAVLSESKPCSICGNTDQARYYRSITIRLTDEGHYHGDSIDVIANHSAITRLFDGCGVYPSLIIATPPQLLLQKIIERLSSILNGNGVWIVYINITRDENSFINSFHCCLLDWLK